MFRAALALLLAVVAIIGLVYYEGANLARDMVLRNETFVPAQASVSAAKCKTHWFVYTRCEVGYRAQHTPGQTLSLTYSFLGPAPEKSFRLIRPVNDQHTIVADVGINHLGNRIALFVLGLAVFAAVGFFSFRRIATA